MKADLNKILAALQQLEQNPNSKSRPLNNSIGDDIADREVPEATNKAVTPSFSEPIPPLQPSSKAPTLPTFDASSQKNAPDRPLVNNNVLPATPPPGLMDELQQIIQQIESLYHEGPIVDGWLESYPCESTPSNDEGVSEDIAAVEYVKAAGSLEENNVVCEAPRSCYRLNGVSKLGQSWSYPCPIAQLPSVSVAIARYEKLLQLVDRKWELKTRLNQL